MWMVGQELPKVVLTVVVHELTIMLVGQEILMVVDQDLLMVVVGQEFQMVMD